MNKRSLQESKNDHKREILYLIFVLAAIQGCLAKNCWADESYQSAGPCLVLDYEHGAEAGRLTKYTWSGRCDPGGFAVGRGTLIAYTDGRVNETTNGEMRHGKLEGGAMTIAGSTTFRGTYVSGLRQGHGQLNGLTSTGLRFHYEGNFEDGLPSGSGLETIGTQSTYVGNFVRGRHQGHGVQIATDKAGQVFRYEGNFENGVRAGFGLLSFENGERYEGEFVCGTFGGKGTWVWANGASYVGEFMNGLPNGQGVLSLADGRIIEGKFADGSLSRATQSSLGYVKRISRSETANGSCG